MLSAKMIGSKIAILRKKKNLSQAELAQQISISPQAVGKWERGESMPDISTLNSLAELFGVDLNYFSESFKSNDKEGITNKKGQNHIDHHTTKSKKKLGLNWNMSSGNWVDADFSGLKNLKDKFKFSNLKNCKFSNSKLSDLTLRANKVVGCDFSNSDLRSCKIQASYFSGNQFTESLLKSTEFWACEIKNCNFSKADFTEAYFKTSEIKNCIIENAVWKMTTFRMSDISEIVFNGKIEDCSFDNCSFSKVIFKNVTIENTFFKSEKLKGIQFIDCYTDRVTYEFLKNGRAELTGITLIN